MRVLYICIYLCVYIYTHTHMSHMRACIFIHLCKRSFDRGSHVHPRGCRYSLLGCLASLGKRVPDSKELCQPRYLSIFKKALIRTGRSYMEAFSEVLSAFLLLCCWGPARVWNVPAGSYHTLFQSTQLDAYRFRSPKTGYPNKRNMV